MEYEAKTWDRISCREAAELQRSEAEDLQGEVGFVRRRRPSLGEALKKNRRLSLDEVGTFLEYKKS